MYAIDHEVYTYLKNKAFRVKWCYDNFFDFLQRDRRNFSLLWKNSSMETNFIRLKLGKGLNIFRSWTKKFEKKKSKLIENEQFSAAKIYWWEKVAKQIFRTDMKGNELDLGKTPLDPLFARFQDFFYCEEHGYFASLPCNPCERILGNIENYVSEATSTETELSCLADVNCCGHTYKAMHPPEDSHHPHFLVYSGMRLLGIRPNTLGDIPAEICIAGETYNLLAVTLHKPGLGKKSLGHYVTAICRGNCEWVCYDALKI